MKIEKIYGENGDVFIKPEGRINVSTADDFVNEVLSLFDGIEILKIDLSDVDYISSAGLRAILEIAKNIEQNGGSLFLINVPRNILHIFKMTGFDRILNIG